MQFKEIDQVRWSLDLNEPVKTAARHITGMLIKNGAQYVERYHVDFISDYDVLQERIGQVINAPGFMPQWHDENPTSVVIEHSIPCLWIVGPCGTHFVWGIDKDDTLYSATEKHGGRALQGYLEDGHGFKLVIKLQRKGWVRTVFASLFTEEG